MIILGGSRNAEGLGEMEARGGVEGLKASNKEEVNTVVEQFIRDDNFSPGASDFSTIQNDMSRIEKALEGTLDHNREMRVDYGQGFGPAREREYFNKLDEVEDVRSSIRDAIGEKGDDGMYYTLRVQEALDRLYEGLEKY